MSRLARCVLAAALSCGAARAAPVPSTTYHRMQVEVSLHGLFEIAR